MGTIILFIIDQIVCLMWEIRPSVFMQQFEKDLNHITAGFGGTFADGDLQWDVGYDYSEGDTQWSLSLIWRFGGDQ